MRAARPEVVICPPSDSVTVTKEFAPAPRPYYKVRPLVLDWRRRAATTADVRVTILDVLDEDLPEVRILQRFSTPRYSCPMLRTLEILTPAPRPRHRFSLPSPQRSQVSLHAAEAGIVVETFPFPRLSGGREHDFA